jgi:sulfur carrier protein
LKQMKVILNGEPKECPEGITIENLLDLYKIDKNRVAVELNLQIIPKKELSTLVLRDTDLLEVVTFVGGG